MATSSRARSLLLALGGAAVVASLAPAAQATYYTYDMTGNFGNNTGPNQKGTFAGQVVWDPSQNAGRGAWTQWTFNFYSQTGSLLQTMRHTDPGAGCFASPIARGGSASGTYAESAPGGSVCVGDNVNADAPNTYPDQTFLNIFNNVNYNWTQGSSNLNAGYSYFRLKFQANGTGGTVNAANLQAVAANLQSVSGLGWAAMTDDTVAGACSGNTSFPTATQPTNNCPYAGNTQNYQGVSGTSVVNITTTPSVNPPPPPVPPQPPAVEAEVPGPLPLLAVPAAFGWSRRLRRRLRSSSDV